MTDNEIKGAMYYCRDFDSCDINCPLFNNDCVSIISKYALDLIKQQQEEIEELKAKIIADDKLLNDRVQEAINSVSKANQKYVDVLEKAFNDKVAELKTAKSEAIKEFAERLKEKLQWDVELENKIVFENDIDNLVKEMKEVE